MENGSALPLASRPQRVKRPVAASRSLLDGGVSRKALRVRGRRRGVWLLLLWQLLSLSGSFGKDVQLRFASGPGPRSPPEKSAVRRVRTREQKISKRNRPDLASRGAAIERPGERASEHLRGIVFSRSLGAVCDYEDELGSCQLWNQARPWR